jgi:hypothetical protein
MKMGTTRSPFPYDAAAPYASQSAKLRHPTTLHYAIPDLQEVRFALDGRPLDKRRHRRHVPLTDIRSGSLRLHTEITPCDTVLLQDPCESLVRRPD